MIRKTKRKFEKKLAVEMVTKGFCVPCEAKDEE
jgi:hypothetical protein